MNQNLKEIEELIGNCSPLPWKMTSSNPCRLVDSNNDAVASVYAGEWPHLFAAQNEVAAFNGVLILHGVNEHIVKQVRIEELEKELEDARIWQARFANDSEAYKQGVEDMIEGLVRYLGLLKGTVYNNKEVRLIEVILHQYRK